MESNHLLIKDTYNNKPILFQGTKQKPVTTLTYKANSLSFISLPSILERYNYCPGITVICIDCRTIYIHEIRTITLKVQGGPLSFSVKIRSYPNTL